MGDLGDNEEILDGIENNQFEELVMCKAVELEEEINVEKALIRRMEPINELVSSERSYVERLKLVSEKYIPLLEDITVPLPEDLSNKWRILWGNWLQLDQWHSGFLEKLDRFVVDEPDSIAKLFLDSRAKLRTIYSKYCENHRKASVIAEQYRDFFEERRVQMGHKQDVVSLLMQPVQRIMRYQLPMGLIVKLTMRANLSSLQLWERALEVMKEIPKDTQLILEAARIDGFPQSITALGNIRMRGELNVAVLSKSEFSQQQSRSSGGTGGSSATSSGTGAGSGSNDPIADLKFSERRVFLFDQMLLITEEVKVKRKDPFAQNSYMFRCAINVNKMKFHPRWNLGENSTGSSGGGGSSTDPQQLQEHDTIFMISDETPGRDKMYVINPVTAENREQWVVQLRDIQRMQQDFLLALQDPRRFASKVDGGLDSSGAAGVTSSSGVSGSTSAAGLASPGNLLKPVSESGGKDSKKKQKWPTFSAGKSSSVLIKHLRPRSEKLIIVPPSSQQSQPTDTVSMDNSQMKDALNNVSDSSDFDNRSSDSVSVGGVARDDTRRVATTTASTGNDILNDDDSATIKQFTHAMSDTFSILTNEFPFDAPGQHFHFDSDDPNVRPRSTVTATLSPTSWVASDNHSMALLWLALPVAATHRVVLWWLLLRLRVHSRTRSAPATFSVTFLPPIGTRTSRRINHHLQAVVATTVQHPLLNSTSHQVVLLTEPLLLSSEYAVFSLYPSLTNQIVARDDLQSYWRIFV